MARVVVLEDRLGADRLTGRFSVRGDGTIDPDLLSGHPPDEDRDLSIDEALRVARQRSDEVGVWVGLEGYSAGSTPLDDLPAWPPDDLDLRPRFDYEPADTRRFDRWVVLVQLRSDGITTDWVKRTLRDADHVVEVRRVEAGPGSATPGGGSPHADVTAEYVVAHRDGTPATEISWIFRALEEQHPARPLEGAGATVWLLGPDAPADEAGPPISAWWRPTAA